MSRILQGQIAASVIRLTANLSSLLQRIYAARGGYYDAELKRRSGQLLAVNSLRGVTSAVDFSALALQQQRQMVVVDTF